MNWPDDTDGDVLRGMQESDFDFEKKVDIDFNIDFEHWPLSEEEKNHVASLYPNCEFIDPTEEEIADGIDMGYVQFQIHDKVTYDLVVNTQAAVSKEMVKLGGWCESWGVMQE